MKYVGFLLFLLFSASGSAAQMNVCGSEAEVKNFPGGITARRIAPGTEVNVLSTNNGWSKIGEKEWVLSFNLCNSTDTKNNKSSSAKSDNLTSSDNTKKTSRQSSSIGHGHSRSNTTKVRASSRSARPKSSQSSGSGCPCSGSHVCIGPRGGRYCITSGGNKRYGI